ncbi:hypothetical protein SAMD00019534_107770, partial [Acytostelium subglobosum LB1]|uniref:hypothetical protein n=1 Tax=Acytostelium subglobosum LB1 TaxID=1410327 RepID=UPI00064517D2
NNSSSSSNNNNNIPQLDQAQDGNNNNNNNNDIDSDDDNDDNIDIHCNTSIIYTNTNGSTNVKDLDNEEDDSYIDNDDEDDDDDSYEIDSKDEDEDEIITLVDYSDQLMSIAIPVSITMILVVVILRTMTQFQMRSGASPLSVLAKLSLFETDNKLQKVILSTTINTLTFLGVTIFSTVMMVVLYKFKYMKALYGWLLITSLLILGVFGGFILAFVLTCVNQALDYATFVIIVWNFSIGGAMCIFWHSPKLINQFYLIILSVIMALFIARFPEWTTWALLTVVSIYDIFAVLCPNGPLRKLIEISKERGGEIPALIYNASVYITMVADNETEQMSIDRIRPVGGNSPTGYSPSSLPINLPTTTSSTTDGESTTTTTEGISPSSTDKLETTMDMQESEPKSSPLTESGVSSEPETFEDDNSAEERPSKGGVKLGLGDFVFYSVLVGRSQYHNIEVVFACFVAVMTGLFITMLLLAIFRRALPALPISIALGVLYYFVTSIFMSPMLATLGLHQIFI